MFYLSSTAENNDNISTDNKLSLRKITSTPSSSKASKALGKSSSFSSSSPLPIKDRDKENSSPLSATLTLITSCKKKSRKSKSSKFRDKFVFQPSKSFSNFFFISAIILYCIYFSRYFYTISSCDNNNNDNKNNNKCRNDDQEEYGYLAEVEQHFAGVHLHQVKCIEEGYEFEKPFDAVPERCGTLITDELVPAKDSLALKKLATRLIYEMGESNYYSRESANLHWANLHNIFKDGYKQGIFNEDEFNLIKNASEAAKLTVSQTFGVPYEKLHFTSIAQFTRYRPITRYSQFRHVDKVRSRSLVITSILWLSNYGSEFGGGTTAFLTGGPKPFTPLLVEPKIGRFGAWTSGWENPHEVMQMLYGERYALIFPFTVNPLYGQKDMDSLKSWSYTLNNKLQRVFAR